MMSIGKFQQTHTHTHSFYEVAHNDHHHRVEPIVICLFVYLFCFSLFSIGNFSGHRAHFFLRIKCNWSWAQAHVHISLDHYLCSQISTIMGKIFRHFKHYFFIFIFWIANCLGVWKLLQFWMNDQTSSVCLLMVVYLAIENTQPSFNCLNGIKKKRERKNSHSISERCA